MRHRQWLGVAVVAISLVAATGCAANDAYPGFDRAATDQDELPEDFPLFVEAKASHDLDFATVRYVGEYEEAGLYLAKTGSEMVCLVVAAGEGSLVGCGVRGILGTRSSIGNFETGPAPIGEKDGWTVISENVRVQND